MDGGRIGGGGIVILNDPIGSRLGAGGGWLAVGRPEVCQRLGWPELRRNHAAVS